MEKVGKLKEFKLRSEQELIKEAKKLTRQKKISAPKTTHLFMHERCLTQIPKPKSPTHIIFAYYHNNHITKIENLDQMYSLTHLHMQWNKITKLEGLDKLYNLKKLYLGNNKISVVENLGHLKNLEELHIEKQNLDTPDGLCFDPKTVVGMAGSLRILNVSENKIRDISWAKPLRRLEVLIAKKNCLENYEEVADNLCTMISLVDVNFIGNPMTKKHRYKETVIARCAHLRILDTVPIDFNSKVFLQGFDRALRLRQLNPRNKFPITPDGADEFFEFSLAGARGPKVTNAVINKPGQTSSTRLEELSKPRAIDSTYTFLQRSLSQLSRPEPRIESPYKSVQSRSFTPMMLEPPPPPKQPILNASGVPVKGILKKPISM